MQSEFLRQCDLQTEHAVNQIRIAKIHRQKQHQHEERRVSPTKYLSEQKINREQENRHMNSLQKKQNTVYFNSKQGVHTIDKAVHRFWINAIRKHLSIREIINP